MASRSPTDSPLQLQAAGLLGIPFPIHFQQNIWILSHISNRIMRIFSSKRLQTQLCYGTQYVLFHADTACSPTVKCQLLAGRRLAAALLPRLFGTNLRSHSKGITSRVQTGDQQLPVLCHCQLGRDIPWHTLGSSGHTHHRCVYCVQRRQRSRGTDSMHTLPCALASPSVDIPKSKIKQLAVAALLSHN